MREGTRSLAKSKLLPSTSENSSFSHYFTLMEAQKIPMQNGWGVATDTNVMHESASSVTLFRHDWARSMGLKAWPYYMEQQLV